MWTGKTPDQSAHMCRQIWVLPVGHRSIVIFPSIGILYPVNLVIYRKTSLKLIFFRAKQSWWYRANYRKQRYGFDWQCIVRMTQWPALSTSFRSRITVPWRRFYQCQTAHYLPSSWYNDWNITELEFCQRLCWVCFHNRFNLSQAKSRTAPLLPFCYIGHRVYIVLANGKNIREVTLQ